MATTWENDKWLISLDENHTLGIVLRVVCLNCCGETIFHKFTSKEQASHEAQHRLDGFCPHCLGADLFEMFDG
jgi:hypothetical protein